MLSETNKLVSIIIPVYNTKKYVGKCINSVINQTYKNIEIILIDDGSNDGSEKVCDEYIKRDIRIKVIHQKNCGVSSARNRGIDIAEGEYLLFVDADDWLESEMCEIMLNNAIESNADMVICRYKEYHEKRDLYVEHEIDKEVINQMSFEKIISLNYIGGYLWNKLIRKRTIKHKFKENIFIEEDLVFLIDNYINCKSFSFIDKCLYNYVIHDNSALHSEMFNKNKLTSLDADKYIIDKCCLKLDEKYKISYVNTYYRYMYNYNLTKEEVKYLKQNYSLVLNKYIKDIVRSKIVDKKTKIKILLKASAGGPLYMLLNIIRKIF